MREKNTLVAHVCFQMPNAFNIWVRNYFFLKNYVTYEGAVSHNVLYYKQLSIVHYQVSFYADN